MSTLFGNVHTHMADLVEYLNDRQNERNNPNGAISVDTAYR